MNATLFVNDCGSHFGVVLFTNRRLAHVGLFWHSSSTGQLSHDSSDGRADAAALQSVLQNHKPVRYFFYFLCKI